MISKITPNHPLRALFSGLVEQVFMTELGICDTRLTDYISALLGDFVHVDEIYQLHNVDGETIRDVSKAEAEAYLGPEVAGKIRGLLVNRYIGDFTLFWTGVYPEFLRKRTAGADRLTEYLLQGRRSYGIASELCDGKADPPADLLRQLSEEFEACVHGLHLVRAGWSQLQNPKASN